MRYNRIVHGGVLAVLALFVITCVSSCKSHDSVVSDRSYHDSAWTVKVVQSGHGDSIVYKEQMIVVPRIIHVGDTDIISMDTTIYKYNERTIYNNYNNYNSSGRDIKDSAAVKEKKASAPKAKNKESSKWRMLWYGIIIGIIIALAALVVFKRKNILGKIRRLRDRNV